MSVVIVYSSILLSLLVIGVCFNALEVWLILCHSPKEMQIYSRILLQISAVDVFTLVVAPLILPVSVKLMRSLFTLFKLTISLETPLFNRLRSQAMFPLCRYFLDQLEVFRFSGKMLHLSSNHGSTSCQLAHCQLNSFIAIWFWTSKLFSFKNGTPRLNCSSNPVGSFNFKHHHTTWSSTHSDVPFISCGSTKKTPKNRQIRNVKTHLESNASHFILWLNILINSLT